MSQMIKGALVPVIAGVVMILALAPVAAQPRPAGPAQPAGEPAAEAAGSEPAQPMPSAGAPATVLPSPPAASASSDIDKTPGETGDDAAAGDQARILLLVPAPAGSLVEEDVAPTLTVFQRGTVELRMGGLLQMHFAPYVGPDSLLSNDDLATRAGFLLRRTRLGVAGNFGPVLALRLVINPLESDPDVGTIADAEITAHVAPWLRVSMGTDKVPFTRGNLESSSALLGIERPLSVGTIVPDRRLGVTVEGEVLGERLAYAAAFMNGTEGYELGNQYGGYLYALRVEGAVMGKPNLARIDQDGIAVGISGIFEDGPATTRMGGSADILVVHKRAGVKLEALCDRSAPKDDPIIAPGVPAAVERCGAYAELSYTLATKWSPQPVVRVEHFDDHRGIDDAGDLLLVAIGANARMGAHARAQLHYLMRIERESVERANNALILGIQGGF